MNGIQKVIYVLRKTFWTPFIPDVSVNAVLKVSENLNFQIKHGIDRNSLGTTGTQIRTTSLGVHDEKNSCFASC